MVVPNILLGSYTYAGGDIIDIYNNCIVLKTENFVGEPEENIFTREQIEDYTIGHNLVMDKSKTRFNTTTLYANSKDYSTHAIHLDLWFGV